MIFLSRFQVEDILDAERAGKKEADVSLDLGKTKALVSFGGGYVVFPDKQRIETGVLGEFSEELTCLAVRENNIKKIHFFLQETGRFYRLVATGPSSPPTIEISGVRMHRTKNTDPMEDTLSKIETIKPLSGRVLDTCTGLGYTAIEALKAGAEEVYTIEEDEGVIQLLESNPWSAGLSDVRIRKIRGDAFEEIKKFDSGFFSAAVHDPPRLALAGRLYSKEFYVELCRVLRRGGRLFHYVGSPGGRYRGRNIADGVVQRLKAAGFRVVVKKPEALGVLAIK